MHKIYSILLTLKDIVICHRAGLNWIEHLKLINQKHKKLTVLFLDKSIHISHWFWFIHGVKELFVDKTYFFQSDSKSPLIIDCGANIGMSVLYFKQLHPTSKVICFEPDTHLFELLKKNISTFEYRNIEFINSAVWKKDGFIKFSANGHVGGKITEIDSGISLPASRLKNFLNQSNG